MEGSYSIQEKRKAESEIYWTFQIIARVGKVAYRLDLPDELSGIHPTFHVSHLRKCLAHECSNVPLNDIEVDEKLNYIEEPVAIVDTKEKQLRNKVIRQVKVQWKHRKGSETTWETEDEMKRLYPHLLETTREMMNVGENRAQNGVTDCPNHETKKIFKVLNFWTRRGTRRRFEDHSRYATDIKYLKSSGFLRGTRSPFWLLVAVRDGVAVQQSDLLIRFHAKLIIFTFSNSDDLQTTETQAKHPPNNLLKPSDHIFEARERVYKS
ncbi:hypothetical protein E3N88_08785 [Mikania micrantha]|uniref:Tf2-1-like SH3-like domain-containing protein n=1 Tax=Mikania micrantha TaxID=192012 RepID=A0A5N6PH79_9ASTR|nr:hypothetical protein E3N88_08785 [Mikania micrantha]